MKNYEDSNIDDNNNNISNSFEEENVGKNYKNFVQENNLDNNDEEKKENYKNGTFEIIENLIDDERISNEEKNKKLKEKNKFQQISNLINKKKYIFLSYFLYIIFIICLSISVGLYNLREVKHNFILLCFELKPIPQNYITNEFFVFLTSVYAIYLILLIILFFLIIICYSLAKDENSFSQIFFEDSSFYLPIFFICFILKSILGNIFLMENFLIYFDLSLTIIGLICLIYFYLKTRKRKYSNIFNLLSQNFFSSVLLCFELYSFIYLICKILTNDKCESYNKTYKYKIELIANLIYFLIAIIIILYNKDIIYPLTFVIIETGLLTKAGSSRFLLVILNIFFLTFMFYSCIFFILTYKSHIFELGNSSNNKRITSI